MASITTMLPDQCTVLRDGISQNIPGSHIVPGDILFLKMGDKVTADVRLVEVSTDAKFDRSILTGTLKALLKDARREIDGNAQASRCLYVARLTQRMTTTSRRRALGWLELMLPRAAPPESWLLLGIVQCSVACAVTQPGALSPFLTKLTDCQVDQCAKGWPDATSKRDPLFCGINRFHHAGHDCGRDYHLVSASGHLIYPIAPCANAI